MYAEKLAGKETYNGDSFADGKAAMAIVGPWAIAVYKGKVDWGVVPVPTRPAARGPDPHLQRREEHRHVRRLQEPGHRVGLPEVLHQQEQDGKLLTLTGQMPLRTDLQTTYAATSRPTRRTSSFAEQAARTVEVPNVANSIEIWQTFRDAWSKSVIFGKADIPTGADRRRNQDRRIGGQS